MLNRLTEHYYRLASTGPFAKWMLPRPFRSHQEFKTPSPMQLEIVSHCWNYSQMLRYQLSSFVLYPPSRLNLTVTVFYSDEDQKTARLLEFINRHEVPNVTWNFCSIDKTKLFRRAIGRNLAALSTTADWVWFTDCDQVFHKGCLDALADILPKCDETLVFPRQVLCTDLLASDDPLLATANAAEKLVEIDRSRFRLKAHEKAVGALQILRGDAARAVGFCNAIPFFQQPVTRWKKTYEDRTFRHLVGSHGQPIEVPNLYRIEHVVKGRKDATAKAA